MNPDPFARWMDDLPTALSATLRNHAQLQTSYLQAAVTNVKNWQQELMAKSLMKTRPVNRPAKNATEVLACIES
ncbi:MAG: hypothetical protein RSB86_06650 [Comamonas sp.]|uniref:hypothetical protein n=1 Tax=Comamonas sp. TaxID=34028 RepID=UPI002FC6A5BB